MSKQSFTPGPWTYTGNSLKEIIAPNVIVMEDDGGCGDPECCGPARYWVELSSDNARLIAAAPELLEALQNVVNEHGTRYLNGTDDRLMPSHRQPPAIRNAMEVIAEATGESHEHLPSPDENA